MKLERKSLVRSAIPGKWGLGRRAPKATRSPKCSNWLSSRAFVGILAAAAALHSIACDAEVQDNTSTTTSGSSSGSGGAAGNAGSGGMGGGGATGGAGGTGGIMDGGSTGVEYFAYNLFTHVPRFVIFKVDNTRNLCFRIFVEGFSGGGILGIDVTDPWAAAHAEVTNNVADCVMSMGFPPQPMSFANAVSGMGTIVVEGSFPCAVSIHSNITFDTAQPWVPMSEAFDADALPVDGGCG
jgi:hypothetical protein